MSILCCGRGSSTPVDKPPVQIQPPKILRRLSLISIPRPQTTRQSIEAFYNEGRELFQARQEESGRSGLRAAAQTASGTATGDFSKDKNINDNASHSGKDLGPKATWDQFFENEGSKIVRLPFRSSSVNELRPQEISMASTTNTHGTMTFGKSMPILGDNLLQEVAQKTPWPIPPGPSRFQGVPDLSPTEISSLNLTVGTAMSKTSAASGTTPISMPSASTSNPCSRPRITTTIISTAESPRMVLPGTGGTIIETGENLLTTTSPRKERKPSNDTTTSDECFSPNGIFSNIAAWVRPSTSTFMSFPSSPDPNRSEVPEIPPRIGNTPDLANSVSSKFYSPPETVATSNTGTSTPAPFHSLTPKYPFHPSVDNASSFYPSCETSRCQSLVGSIGTFPEPFDMSVLSAATTTYVLSQTPRPSDVTVNDSLEYPTFRFPWMNRGAHKSPEPATAGDVFTRSSSLAHLDQSQKRSRDLQRVPRVKPRDLLKHPQPGGPLAQKYDEEVRLQERAGAPRMVARGLGHVPNSGSYWPIDDDGNQECYNNDTMVSPTSNTDDSGYAGWTGPPTRVSSLPVPNGMARDARNRRPPHIWKYGNPEGNTFSNYGKDDIRNPLRNSISLGERMWERHGTHNGGQENPRNTRMANPLVGPIPGPEPQDEGVDRNGRRTNKRAMIRSRSMTLRRTFTNSIAKLRGKVSFSGSSKAALTPPSPIDRPGNRDRFYQIRHERQRAINNTPDVLNEKIREEVDVPELDMASIIFGPTLPKEMLEHEIEKESSKNTSPGNGTPGNDSLELGSPLSLATTEFRSTSEGHRSRPWSTIYDDCVASPFAEDEAGEGTESELETPMSGFFDARERRLRLVWRDAKESIEVSA